MRTRAVLLGFVGGLLMFPVINTVVPGDANANPPEVVVRIPLPPVRVEIRSTVPARPGAVWVPGYWHWRGANWAWVHGQHRRPARPGWAWVGPRYQRRGEQIVYVPGYWAPLDRVPPPPVVWAPAPAATASLPRAVPTPPPPATPQPPAVMRPLPAAPPSVPPSSPAPAGSQVAAPPLSQAISILVSAEGGCTTRDSRSLREIGVSPDVPGVQNNADRCRDLARAIQSALGTVGAFSVVTERARPHRLEARVTQSREILSRRQGILVSSALPVVNELTELSVLEGQVVVTTVRATGENTGLPSHVADTARVLVDQLVATGPFAAAPVSGPTQLAGRVQLLPISEVGGTGSLDVGSLRVAIEQQLAGIRNCYESRLGQNARLGGEIRATFTVAAAGTAPSAQTGVVSRADLPSAFDPALGDCVRSGLRGVRTPAPTGGSVDYTATFVFAR